MANPYELFKTNEELEKEKGVILDYGDFRIKIARAGGANKKFGEFFRAKVKPFKRQQETDTMDEAVSLRILIDVYVQTVILDMDVLDKENSTSDEPKYISGILDSKGNILPFDKKGATKLFNDLPELFRDVQSQAQNVALFRQVEQEEQIKNSQLPLSGI